MSQGLPSRVPPSAITITISASKSPLHSFCLWLAQSISKEYEAIDMAYLQLVCPTNKMLQGIIPWDLITQDFCNLVWKFRIFSIFTIMKTLDSKENGCTHYIGDIKTTFAGLVGSSWEISVALHQCQMFLTCVQLGLPANAILCRIKLITGYHSWASSLHIVQGCIFIRVLY